MKSLFFILILILQVTALSEEFSFFKSLPVQDEGRVKPLGTYADITLLKFNGKRSFKLENGQKLSSIDWLVDVLFFTEKADSYKHFVTDNAEAFKSIGLPDNAISSKRMRFSFNDLKDFKDNLYLKADEALKVDPKNRNANEMAILNMAFSMRQYIRLKSTLDFARAAQKMPPEIIQILKSSNLADFLENLDAVRKGLQKSSTSPDFNYERVKTFFESLKLTESKFFLIPSADKDTKQWLSMDDIVVNRLVDFKDELEFSSEYSLMKLWQNALVNKDTDMFKDSLKELIQSYKDITGERGEYEKIPTEVKFYEFDYFTKSLIFSLLGFLIICFSWLKSGTKLGLNLCRTSFGVLIISWLILCAGITMRCIIRERPPVTTLYETILFITAVCCLVSLIIAVIRNSSLMVGVTALTNSLGMFLAIKYEMKEAADTMPQLQAVLDTNFWLSTHVTTVTMGYAAGLLAGIVSHFYLILKFLDFKGYRTFTKKESSELTKYVYGIICFGLIFSFIGTVLGGIWANYSWGRFWGWDPKENGAMLIVLWFIVILHARMGGYVRQLGVHLLSVASVIIICFSWWGVNLLGVGLHSYGFTSGISRVLMMVYVLEVIVIIAGIILHKLSKNKPDVKTP